MFKNLILLFFSTFLLFSCSDESTINPTFTDANPNNIEIRVVNSSGFLLNNVEISNRSISKNFGDIKKNRETDYISFSKADSYFGVQFIIENYLFEYEPSKTSDLLDEGFYSISIYSVDTAKQTFTFLLEEE